MSRWWEWTAKAVVAMAWDARRLLDGVVVGNVRRIAVSSSAPVAGYLVMDECIAEGGLR